MKRVGIALVILGIVGLYYGVAGYDRRSTILDLGGIKATATEHRTVPMGSVAGALALIGGLVLLMAPRSKRP